MSNGDLVRKAQKFSEEKNQVIGILHERLSPEVRTIVSSKVNDWNDVNDVVQEVFLHFAKELEQLKNPDKVSEWIKSVAYRQCQDFHRKRLRNFDLQGPGRTGELDDFQFANFRFPDPSNALERKETLAEVRQRVRDLPQNERLVIERFHLSDSIPSPTFKEIATELEIPTSTAKRRAFDGRNRLRDEWFKV